MRRPLERIILALLQLPAATVGAHDFWIEPSLYQATEPTTIEIGLRVGQHFKGDSVPYVDTWIRRFEVRDGAGSRPVTGQVGDDPAGRFRLRQPGATWILYQSNDDFVELAPAKFRDYLLMEGMDYILPLRVARGQAERPAREFYLRSVKSLLWWPEVGARFDGAVTGLPLDLVPRNNPYLLAAGGLLELEVRFFDQPVAGVMVKAHTRERPDRVVAARSDADGRLKLPLEAAGEWLVKAVHMVALENNRDADWRSYWASLTFRLAER